MPLLRFKYIHFKRHAIQGYDYNFLKAFINNIVLGFVPICAEQNTWLSIIKRF